VKRWLRVLAWIFGLGLALLGGAAAFLYTPDLSVADLEARYTVPGSRFITVNGTRVHVTDRGPRDAPVLILVHGTGGSLHVWDGWVAPLSKRYRIIAFDLPGHGLTGPASDRDYSIEGTTRLIGALATALGVERFALAGHSMGGMVTWWAAGQALQHRVVALILIDASGYPAAGPPPLGIRIARLPLLGEVASWLRPSELTVRNLRRGYADPSLPSDAAVVRHLELMRRPGNRVAAMERVRSFTPPDPKAIQLVRVPTLILWGDTDRFVSLADARRFNRDIPGSQLVVYPSCGHNPMEERAAESAADVYRFLEAVVTR
jgi:pimeloyl-ACP methyl ester carboxylesterase